MLPTIAYVEYKEYIGTYYGEILRGPDKRGLFLLYIPKGNITIYVRERNFKYISKELYEEKRTLEEL